MSPQARAQRPSADRVLRSLDGGGDGRQGRDTRHRRPTLVAVRGGQRGQRESGTGRAGNAPRNAVGRMRKGESPRERGERTRARITEAVLDLLAASDLPPTAREVAAEAGVSVRLVFHHFEDMDALFRAAAHVQVERHWGASGPVSASLSKEQRIERTVQQRAKLFEAVGPVRRKAVGLAVRYPDVAEGLEVSNAMARNWLEETFADELRSAKRNRRELLASLDAAASWETWDRLRRVQGLPVAGARRVMVRTLHGLLEA